MSPRSAPRSSASRPRSSSARSWAGSASTGAASRPRRCCARPRCCTICSHADSFGLVAGEVKPDLAKIVARSRAVAKQLNQGVTHLMKKNKIAVHMGEGTHHRAGQDDGHQRTARRPSWPPSTSSSPPARGRASCPSPRRRQADLDLPPRDDPAGNADRAAGHRLGRDRDRVRQLLQRHGRQGDGGRDARPGRAGRGCRGQRLPRQEPRQAGHDAADVGAGVESLKADAKGVAAKIKTKDGKVEEKRFSHCIVAVGIVAQHREYRAREAGRRRPTKGHIDTDAMCRTNVAGHLGDRRRHRAALAGAQGEP